MNACRCLCGLVWIAIAGYSAASAAEKPVSTTGPTASRGVAVDPGPAPAIGRVIVHGRFGGRIFGFGIDETGTEGLLSEAQNVGTDEVLAAVETFDLRTGEIIRLLAMTETHDDFITLGVVGDGVGLVEFEHEIGFLEVERTFHAIIPLESNRFTLEWTPPIGDDHLIEQVSRNQGTSDVAVYASDIGGGFTPIVFRSNVAANTFGPVIPITDENFATGLVPALAYNAHAHQAVLGVQALGNPFVPPVIALIDLNDGTTSVFGGVGLGDVNGIAVDPARNIACTTTEIDFSVQFYDLATHSGFSQFLPGAVSQFYSGADVAVDSQHGLFLVAQPNSSTAPGTSSIHVYDMDGNLVESIDGFHFSNASNVVRMHIALHPAQRFGYVDGPDAGVTEIQGFRY